MLFSEQIIFNNDVSFDTNSKVGSVTAPISHITIHKDEIKHISTTYSFTLNNDIYKWFFDTRLDCCEMIDEHMFVGMTKCDTTNFTINIPSTPFTISLDILQKSQYIHAEEKN